MAQQLTLVVEGLSEEQVREDIRKNTEGFRLFFYEPKGVDYQFLNSFWGEEWNNYDPQQLKDAIIKVTGIPNTGKHYKFIVVFALDGIDRFAFCEWTRQLYDFHTEKYYDMEKPFAKSISEKIKELQGATAQS